MRNPITEVPIPVFFMKILGVAAGLTLSALWVPSALADESEPRPNIIYVMLDDAGYGDFGAFGSPHVKTPTFDRLCAEGMRFNHHYSGSAVCAPTRCVLMTGLHTGHCRRRDNTAKRVSKSSAPRTVGRWCSWRTTT